MKKLIKIFALFTIILSINIVVQAATCDSNELARLKELANNIEVKYKENIKEETVGNNVFKNVSYSITVTNLNEDLKVMIVDDLIHDKYKEFKSNTGEATLSGFQSGEKVTITIMAFVANDCAGKTLLTKVVQLPYYNIFSEEEECQQYPDFKYCVTWLEDSITRETFNSELTKYIDSLKTNAEPVKNEDNSNNYVLIIAIVGGIILIGIVANVVLLIQRKRKNSL